MQHCLERGSFVPSEFTPVQWDDELIDDCRQLVRLAVREDLGRALDWTTVSLVPEEALATASVVARSPGVAAGLLSGQLILEEMDIEATWTPQVDDGKALAAGEVLAVLEAPARDLLTAERTLLNFLGRLCGVATNTRNYVEAIEGTPAQLYDTRKTTPGWRRLEKYAVRCGGGNNHRAGLYDAVLIKDNHLAYATQTARLTLPEAILAAKEFLAQSSVPHKEMVFEVEVDTLEQLQAVLRTGVDIVLLDNMSTDQLRAAIALRDEHAPEVVLEASGGINLDTIRAVAETGVDRISCGALTHSAINFDVGLDWGRVG